MTLQNLLQTGQLKKHEATAEEIRTLLGAVRRNLADAEVAAISFETRFDAAYKAIMRLSLVALMANGFRPGSGAGHHMTMIQTLPKTIGLENRRLVVLDALRRKRNVADYLGGYVDQSAAET
ncbi:MAG: DNA-binding protein [Deltaproteobacteria bacterium]|nr:DNA-binding protein [Deltaproteobacteria bacterium]